MNVCTIDGIKEDCELCVMEDGEYTESDCDVLLDLIANSKPHTECTYYVHYDPPTVEEMKEIIKNNLDKLSDNRVIDIHMMISEEVL